MDGIAVENFQQYRVARGASADPVMRLTVWRDGRYVDVETQLRHNWVVNALDTYPARGQ